MPFIQKWVKPKRLLRHKGISVYHTYKNDDYENMTRDYYFVLRETDGESDEPFDVRELSTWKAPKHPPYVTGKKNRTKRLKLWEEYYKKGIEKKAIISAIKQAIDKKEIKMPESE